MTPQELKNSILQLAIQGKLVKQYQEEGTAEELYQHIRQEKQKLIQNGKIKKEKPLPEITEEEKPFDIPDTWIWMRLGECTSYAQTKEKVSPNAIPPEIWSLDLEDIEKDTGEIKNYCKAKNRKIIGDKVLFHKGQILYSKLRPYLKKIIVAPDDGICTPELVPFYAYGEIVPDYLVAVLKSPHIDYMINSVTYGVKMPRVGTDTMISLLVPLPPIAEQKRIVAKIEELLPLIDRYEKAWSQLEEFNKKFPGDMQKSILQMAIQGKLVEQQPEEGTGEELYQHIQQEKQKLIQEGKIKKEKPLPEITEEDKPFDIPDNWKWTRLSQAALTIVDCPHSTPHYYESKTEYSAIDTNCIDSDGNIIAERYVDQDTYNNRVQRLIPQENDIVYTREGSICRAAILPAEKNICLGQRVMLIRCPKRISERYVKMILMAPQTVIHLTAKQKGIGAKHVNVADVCLLPIPLPPLPEQKRIVDKLENLLPLCNDLIHRVNK